MKFWTLILTSTANTIWTLNFNCNGLSLGPNNSITMVVGSQPLDAYECQELQIWRYARSLVISLTHQRLRANLSKNKLPKGSSYRSKFIVPISQWLITAIVPEQHPNLGTSRVTTPTTLPSTCCSQPTADYVTPYHELFRVETYWT